MASPQQKDWVSRGEGRCHVCLLSLPLCLCSHPPAFAAPCKDAKGKFIKCPPPVAAPASKGPCKDAKGKFVKCPPPAAASSRCKDAKGKFVKCGTPGTKPA